MIRTNNVKFKIGDFQLGDISLDISKGEYFVLLGPPGSGKTIFLECLCGLKKIDSGKIHIDGRDVTALEPRMRGIGYVPQDYALFAHLSVEGNIAFGLHGRGFKREQIKRKVAEIAEMLKIEDLLERGVYGLSGGEKQRVALGRALILEPRVLLLDEPVCALDELTRQNICALLLRIQRKFGLATIQVSHNLEEAFSVADRAGILHKGVVQQTGPLDELLRRPNSEFVARFMRCENIFCGEVVESSGKSLVKVGEVQIQIPGRRSGTVKFVIRPEDVLVSSGGKGQGENENEFAVKMVCWRDYGRYVRIELDGLLKLVVRMSGAEFAKLKTDADAPLRAVLPPESIHILPKQAIL